LTTFETVWWLLFCSAVGLCLGSFLNVVIYRIPAGLSIWNPRWSFCPACNARIPWYDNLPLVSYLRLGGRSRCCGTGISFRYPVVEVAMAVIVLLLFDTFFVDRARAGLSETAIGLSWRLAEDWPIFVAHVLLFACLLAMSAIDMEHYWIDTAFATLAVIAGFVLHAIWTPAHSVARAPDDPSHWIRPLDATALACSAAFVGLLVSGVVQRVFLNESVEPEPDPADTPATSPEEAPHGIPDDRGSDEAAANGPMGDESPNDGIAAGDRAGAAGGSEQPADADAAAGPAPTAGPTGRPRTTARNIGGWLLAAVLGAMLVLIAWAAIDDRAADPATWRLAVPLVGLFGLIVAIGVVKRPADVEIVEAIEAERGQARAMVLREFAWLFPAILLAGGAVAAYATLPAVRSWWSACLHWTPRAYWEWQPVFGLATAATGYVISAAMGWTIRISATLIYGKEAFGDGDIHIMAAAGCVAGWPVVLLGFILTCVVALAGWLVSLPFKQTRAIPLVPWLSLSFLSMAVFYESALNFPPVQNVIELAQLLGFQGKS
jgi:prepilin signal peptidase PulO-like enzyme (type II secretory pathway)